MTFRNVDEFKKWLVKSGLVWSRTLLILLSMNAEIISVPVFAQRANISINFTAGSWKTKQLNEMSAKVPKMWTKCVFCALLRLSNNTTLDKNAIFRWFCFPQVVQKQTLSEVGNYIMIWWPVVSGIFLQKLLKSDNPPSSYDRKCLGCFFETRCVLSAAQQLVVSDSRPYVLFVFI